MPKAKMKFPKIPGDTPREQFINLARQAFSVGKPQSKKQGRRARKRTAK
jgi:hypothetical protein